MAEQLPNAPVALVRLEARSSHESPVDPDRWQEFAKAITTVTPNVQRTERSDAQGVAQLRASSEDGSLFGWISPERLSMTQRAPYPSWEALAPSLGMILGAFWRLSDSAIRASCTLEYQNHIRVGADRSVQPRDYFNLYPGLSGDLDNDFIAFMSGIVIPAADDQSLLRVEVVSSHDEDEPDALFTDLHISFTTADETFLSKHDAASWLDTAHAQVEAKFFAALTERALRLMRQQ